MASPGRRAPGIRSNAEYTPVNISFLSKQKIDFPDPSFWRNNLVAASRCYNYVFIALRSRIHVYQPTYPSQTFPQKPLYILDSQPSTTTAGFIDPRFPHAINSLTIGELGVEEVLVSAHDNGDICVWYTRDLTRIAIQKNVGISAWGVALHKEKRLLAVSSNSRLIHVFDLGFKDEEREMKQAKQALFEDRERDGLAIPQLNENTVKILSGHGHNIPSISFLDDPSGNWLVGTSIDGMVIVWDIENEQKVNAVRLGGHSERGWSVLFLQPECFLPTRNEAEAVGGQVVMNGNVCDISPVVSSKGSHALYSYGLQDWETGESDLEDGESEDGAETEDYEDDDDVSSDDYMDPSEAYYPQHEAGEVGSSVDHSMDEGGDEDGDEESWDENDSVWADSRRSSQPAQRVPPSPQPPPPPLPLPPPPAPRNLPPQSFVFSTSEYNVQLYGAPSLDKIVICEHVLHSRPPLGLYQDFGAVDRLNMVCVIPELSMVVAASQKGRAAIFRLTQNEAGFMMRLDDMLPRQPNDPVRSGTVLEEESYERPIAALLGIAVSPIQGREFGRSRSNSEGQNMGRPESDGTDSSWQDPHEAWARKRRGVWRGLERRRRYRLMMVYIDGTILSYELGGTPDSELSACTVDGGYLMV